MGREVEREREKHQSAVTSCLPPSGDRAPNPGMCPDWESNQRPFASQAGTQSTEPQQPGPMFFLFTHIFVTSFALCSFSPFTPSIWGHFISA